MSATVKRINENTVELSTETRTVFLSSAELSAINRFSVLDSLRTNINYVVNDMIDDESIDINDYPYSKEELIDEIYVDFEDKIDNDEPFPSDNDIYDSVIDLIDFYVNNR